MVFQGVSISDDGKINVSGTEFGFAAPPKGIVIACNQEVQKKDNIDYICEKFYPGDSVDIFANLKMKR